eukprot:c3332_g1_i2 orf=2-217(-)
MDKFSLGMLSILLTLHEHLYTNQSTNYTLISSKLYPPFLWLQCFLAFSCMPTAAKIFAIQTSSPPVLHGQRS